MERTEELEDQVRSLTRTVEEMRARLDAVESGEPKHENGSKPSSRRNFLRLGAAAALGAVGMAASKVLPAAAATGGPVLLGTANSANLPTTIAATSAGTPVEVLAAQDFTFSAGALATAGGFQGSLQGLGSGAAGNPLVEGVDGWAQGTRAFGVYGLTDSGTGVTGESATGIGLYARRSGRIRQDGLIPAGTSPQGVYTPNDFEIIRDAAGVMWISQAGGAWKRVTTNDLGLQLFPDPRRLYAGNFSTTAPGTFLVDATAKVNPSNGQPNGPSGVPAGALAAFCAVQSYSAGVMTLYPDGAADPGLANWSSTANGPLNLTYVFVPLSTAGKFRMHTYFTGQKYIDAWGYVI
jgi:hypothetical protein